MKFRFSGHESFPCRYTWLPKGYKAIANNPEIFGDDDLAMVTLGVGKNMVKSIKFWLQAFGISKGRELGGLENTNFGDWLLGENGTDRYLEDLQTLLLLHWKVSSIKEDPLFSWYFMLSSWSDPFFSKSEILGAFTKESEKMNRPLADFTKEQHFDIFLRSYLPVKAKKKNDVLEDSLDCPLAELQFILPSGERQSGEIMRREPVYEFSADNDGRISDELFSYCIYDYWKNFHPMEASLSLRQLSSSPCSVGQVFKLREPELRHRLERIFDGQDPNFEYIASAAVPRLVKHFDFSEEAEHELFSLIHLPITI